MPKQKITVEFTQTGAPELIKSIHNIANAKNKLNGVEKDLTKNTKEFSDEQQRVTKRNRDAEKGFKGLLTTAALARNKLLLVSFAAGLVVRPIANVTRNAINAAASFQSLQVRLTQLFGSIGEGRAAFQQFNAMAAKTPFALEDIVNAGAQFKAFGGDSRELLDEITDLAAFMGTTATEAANSLGRAFAGGAGAADILRERGVLNLVKSFAGVEDLSKLTLPEFRKALIGAMQDPAIGIQGATEAMADTYVGKLSNMQDATQRMNAALGNVLMPAAEAAVTGMTNLANAVGDFFREVKESDLATMVRQLQEMGVESDKLKVLELKLNDTEAIKKIRNIGEELTKVAYLATEMSAGDYLMRFTGLDNFTEGFGGKRLQGMRELNSFMKDELGLTLTEINDAFKGKGGFFDTDNIESMVKAVEQLIPVMSDVMDESLALVDVTEDQTQATKDAFDDQQRNLNYLEGVKTKLLEIIKIRTQQKAVEDYLKNRGGGEDDTFSDEDMKFVNAFKDILAKSNEKRIEAIDKQIEMLKLFEKEGRFAKENTFKQGEYNIVLRELIDLRKKYIEEPTVDEDEVMTTAKMTAELEKQRDEYTNLQNILKELEDTGFYDENNIPEHLRKLSDDTKKLNEENEKLENRLKNLYKGTEKSQKEAIQSNIDFLKSNRDNKEMLDSVGMTVEDVDASIKKYTEDLNKLSGVLDLQTYPEFLAHIKKQASEFKNSSNNMDTLIKNYALLDDVYKNYIKTQMLGLQTTDDVNKEIALGVIELQNFEDMQKHVEGMYHGMNDMQKKVAESLGFLSDEFKELHGIGVEETFGNIEKKLKSLFETSTKGTVAGFMGDISNYREQRAELEAQMSAEETSADQKEELAKRIKTLDAGYEILNKQFQDYTNGLHAGGRALTKVMQFSKKHNSEQRNELVAYRDALKAIDDNSISTEALANEKRNATRAILEFDAANGDTDAAFKLYVMNAQDSMEADKLSEEHKQMLIDKYPLLAEHIGLVNQGFTSYVKELQASKDKEDEALRNKMHLIKTDRDQARELGLLGDTYKEFKNNLEVQVAMRDHLIDKTKKLRKEEEDLYNQMVKSGKIQSVEQLEGTKEDPYKKFKESLEDRIKSQKEEEGLLEKLIRLEPALYDEAVKRKILDEDLTDTQIKQNQQYERLAGLLNQVQVSLDVKLQKDLENLNSLRNSEELQEKYNLSLEDLDVIQQQVIKNFQKASEEANKANKEMQEFINTTAEDISGFGDSPDLLGENPFQKQIDSLEVFKDKYQDMVDGMKNPTDQMINNLQEVQEHIDMLTKVGKFLQVGEAVVEIAEGFMTSIQMVVDSYSDSTQAALDEDMSRLRNSLRYQKSSREAQMKMEEGIKDKHREDMLRAFRFQRAIQLAETVMNTATSIMQAVELNPGGLGLPQSAIIAAQGAAQIAAIMAQRPPSYEHGGLVGGRRHSSGGTIIEAEQGEFIMSRTAVKNIGVTTLNRMNRGMGGSQSINIMFEGNVLSEDFIVEEAIPKIRDAIRRGEILTD